MQRASSRHGKDEPCGEERNCDGDPSATHVNAGRKDFITTRFRDELEISFVDSLPCLKDLAELTNTHGN